MRSEIDMSLETFIKLFNKISKILYAESEGKQESLLRTIRYKVIESDVRILSKITKEIISIENMGNKYQFITYNDNNIKAEDVFTIIFVNDVKSIEKIGIAYFKNIPLFNDIPSNYYIYIDQSMISNEKSNTEKYFLLRKAFLNIFAYNVNSINEDLKKQMSKIASIFAYLLIDIDPEDASEANTVTNILSKYIVTGIPYVTIIEGCVTELYSELISVI